MKVNISTEIDIHEIHINGNHDTAKALILALDKDMEDGDFTLDIIRTLVLDLRNDYSHRDLRDFLKKLRKELK